MFSHEGVTKQVLGGLVTIMSEDKKPLLSRSMSVLRPTLTVRQERFLISPICDEKMLGHGVIFWGSIFVTWSSDFEASFS